MRRPSVDFKSHRKWFFFVGALLLALGSASQHLQLIYGITFTFTNILLLMLVRLYGMRIVLPVTGIIYATAIFIHHDPSYIVIFLLEVCWIGLWQVRRPGYLLGPDAIFWLCLGAPITFIACWLSGTFSLIEFILLFAITASNGLFNTLIAEMLINYLPLGRWLGLAKDMPLPVTFRRVLFHLSITLVALPFLMNMIVNGRNAHDVSTRTTLQTASNTANSIRGELDQWKQEDVLGVRLEGLIQIGYLQEMIKRNTTQKLFDITITSPHNKVLATNSKESTLHREQTQSVIPIEDNFLIEVPVQSTVLLPTQQWRNARYVYAAPMERFPLIISVSVPVKSYQVQIFREYIYQLLYMLANVTIAALLAWIINWWLGRSLMQLARSTTNLPVRLKQMVSLEWPNSGILEIDSLTHNFKDMSQNLLHMFQEALWMNQRLRSSEKKLHQLAYYDSLTTLPNRLQFHQVLSDLLLQEGDRTGRIAVMFMDLNRFKQINDTLGHAVGDVLLRKVAERFIEIADESCRVFRLGGDEFVFVMCYETSNAPQNFAERICDCFEAPFELDGSSLYTTISIGISLYPEHGTSMDDILKKADMAMYVAKEQGTSSYHFFSQALEDSLNEKMYLENGLRNALLDEQFFLVYQPMVSPASGKITGIEVLIRWHHPEGGIISPAKFIPLAETSGLIVDIDLWVLRKACMQVKEWQDRGLPKIPVSVNLSAKQFYRTGLLENIRTILEETGLNARYINLEITESVFIKQMDPVIETLTQLRNMGIQISIDDFGTGYSSLSQLQRLPISVVKLDRTFIQDAEQSEMKSSIVKAVIELAHSMGLKVVAEGIETEQERDFFTRLECDKLQGFYFSKPLNSSNFEQYLITEYSQ
ncbi:putative bifunctional diguanylate cyclase/phosphodiesterase [Paenibacillus sp. IHBB 10380]|uniref:putative bifunctional diguanylate cyclase/phosphodiesterase n=1 Tax=Paenibacillus sp. IHBB 10380 TaxID=1566358 RepID=UPI0005CF9D97|nr:EAL domain-containing protein [Paenibacillus sp. IHBB 10380]